MFWIIEVYAYVGKVRCANMVCDQCRLMVLRVVWDVSFNILQGIEDVAYSVDGVLFNSSFSRFAISIVNNFIY